MKKILLLLTIVLFSCEKQTQFEKNLTQKTETTFWAKKAKDSLNEYNYFGQQFTFNKDKTSEVFFSENENIKGEYGKLSIEGKNEKGVDWDYYEENNLFVMIPDIYEVTKYSNDTIYMHLLIGKQEQFIMVRKRVK